MFDSLATILPLVINAVAWCLLAMWIVMDPFLPLAVDLLLIDLQVRPKPPFGDGGFHAFSRLGWRILLLPLLTFVGAGSTIFLLVSALARPNSALVATVACCVTVTLCWLLLLAFHSTWNRCGRLLRIRFIVPVARRLATELNECWPDLQGTLPWVGKYAASADAPDMLTVCESHSRFPVWESCGTFIRRDPAGIVRFDLASAPAINLSLEVFFNGALPHSYQDVFNGFHIKRELQGNVQLHDGVFLTWYKSDIVVDSDRGMEVLREVTETLGSAMAKRGHKERCPCEQPGT